MVATNHARQYDPRAPLIVIGAGRSGSTVLANILDAHPAISFQRETNFLGAKLWDLVWAHRSWYNWQSLPEAAVGERVAAGLADSLATIFVADPGRSHWGFKEVWNGSVNHRHPWEIYDRLFPEATWLHLVRHPLEFAASCAAWMRDELTVSYLEDRLADWVSMVEYSRKRKTRPHFHEVRYEDLIVRPRDCLSPVLDNMGLSWSEACETPLRKKFLASQRDNQKEASVFDRFRRPRRLAELAASLAYDV